VISHSGVWGEVLAANALLCTSRSKIISGGDFTLTFMQRFVFLAEGKFC